MQNTNKMVRVLSADGSVIVCAVDATEIVGTIEQLHTTSAVVTAALGRLAAAASMLGAMLKGQEDTVTLRINGGGPAGSLIAVADGRGNVKAYVANPVVEIPLNQYGKLDVAGAVGTDGYLSVIKDVGLDEPSTGTVELVSGEIAEDITVIVCAVDATEIVGTIEQLHTTSAVVTAALGRLAAAASMLGAMLKGQEDTVTLRINGGGPAGSLIAVADGRGNVKAYVANPVVEIPLNQYGKLDVAGAVGTDGYLSVIKDVGLDEPSTGTVELVSGEIAEDITNYFAVSEQIPTVCGLGVLVNPDLTVKGAGGYLVQLLPFADESCIEVLENNLKQMPPVSQMYADGMTPEEVCMKLLDGLEPNVLDTFRPVYQCDCSRDRISRALISMGKQELEQLAAEQETTEVSCHFCNKKYVFTAEELLAL